LFRTVDRAVAAPDRGKDIGVARRDGDALVAELGGSILARLVVVSVPSDDGAKRASRLEPLAGAVVFSIGARRRPAVASGVSEGYQQLGRFAKAENSGASPHIRGQFFH